MNILELLQKGHLAFLGLGAMIASVSAIVIMSLFGSDDTLVRTDLEFGEFCTYGDQCYANIDPDVTLRCTDRYQGGETGTCQVYSIKNCISFTPSTISEAENKCTVCESGFTVVDGRCKITPQCESGTHPEVINSQVTCVSNTELCVDDTHWNEELGGCVANDWCPEGTTLLGNRCVPMEVEPIPPSPISP